MQAIRTRFYGPTNHRGARIRATSAGGTSVTIDHDDALSSEDNHRAAVEKLATKLGWRNDYVPGFFGGDTYWAPVAREPLAPEDVMRQANADGTHTIGRAIVRDVSHTFAEQVALCLIGKTAGCSTEARDIARRANR